MQTATIISIVSATIIIGLSIGVTMYLDPTKKYSSLDHLKSSVSSSQSMETRCNNLLNSLTTTQTDNTNANNVMNYNLQRMYGECEMKVDDGTGKTESILVDLIPMTGCHSDNDKFTWSLKPDAQFDFCPNLEKGKTLST
tara:strand:- start:319 stop:738 length:420 start_codon:yes stop_codon:yes gene_type:complete